MLNQRLVCCPCFRAACLTVLLSRGKGREMRHEDIFSLKLEGLERKLTFGKGEAKGREKYLHANWKGFRVKCYL